MGRTKRTIRYYSYKPYNQKELVTIVSKKKVPKDEAKPVDFLIVNLGGPFQEVGGKDENIGGDDTKMG